MATITATAPASLIAGAGIGRKGFVRIAPSSVLGLPAMDKRGRTRCSVENKLSSCETNSNVGMNAALMTAASAAVASPAMALVDERMSTEGTGLPFGLSNNLLGWILFGIFGLIWALYFVYTSTLEEDDDSGLSL
ncbi:Photosystem II PsbW [Macleaya cordata]|uniref:PSII 6.1 kDa protein n=1 Tax=Macleaya cordata TaxID=56857 RepID=A0A200Q4E5_MACCD|nr:Photosystem II PsbW [Macleaya cordata]